MDAAFRLCCLAVNGTLSILDRVLHQDPPCSCSAPSSSLLPSSTSSPATANTRVRRRVVKFEVKSSSLGPLGQHIVLSTRPRARRSRRSTLSRKPRLETILEEPGARNGVEGVAGMKGVEGGPVPWERKVLLDTWKKSACRSRA